MTISAIARPRASLVRGVVLAGRVDVPVRDAFLAAEVAFRADVIEDRVVAVRVLHEENLLGAALLALLRLPADVLPAEHRASETTRDHTVAGVRNIFRKEPRWPSVFLRFSRFRFREGKEPDGIET